MIVCLITDRRRLAARLAAGCDATTALVRQVAEACRGGVDLVQVREPDLPGGELCRVVEQAVRATRGTATKVVVNDRLDVALAAGADGVHLRSASFGARRVRELAPPGFVVGRSVHGAAEAREVVGQGGVDYLIAGTVFATPSKPDAAVLLGMSGLAEVVRAAGAVPVLAIGGITLESAAGVARAGAAGVAAIGFFLGEAGGPVGPADRVPALRRAFDTPRTDSLT